MPHFARNPDWVCARETGHSGPCLPADLNRDPTGRTVRSAGSRKEDPVPVEIEFYVPKPGDIGMVRMPGAVGKLIRAGQWLNGDGFADYEHAFVVVGEVEDTPNVGTQIIEAMPGGALLSPLSRYDGFEPVYLRCPPALRDDVAAAALSFRGVKYSALDYAALAAHRFHIPAPHLRDYIRTSGHMICSQLADRAAYVGGWFLFDDNRWFGYVTPLDIHRLYLKQITDW